MEPAAWINDFLAWAWERHHNVLSRYVRPLFVLPLAYMPACGLLRRGVACRIIDRAVAGPAAPWHDGRERGRRMNRRQIPTSGGRVRGARP
jgi:hypothetical protein